MQDQNKTKQQLVAELTALRQRVDALQTAMQGKETEAANRLQAAPLAIHECDAEGRITFVNAAQERVTGYAAAELIGRHAWDRIVPGAQKDGMPGYFKQLVAEQPPPTPFFAKNVRKNGEVYDTRVDWDYIRNTQGEVKGFISIISDVTEQKKLEADVAQREESNRVLLDALRESERTLRTLMSNLPGIAYRCRSDPFWTTEFVSAGCQQLTGYEPQDLIGDWGTRYAESIHPDDVPFVSDQVQQAVNQRRHFQFQYRIRTAQGQEKWVWEQGTPVFSASGELEGLEGFITDITERKRAEEALRQSEERMSTLLRAIPDLMFRLNAQGQFIDYKAERGAWLLVPPSAFLGKHYSDVLPAEVSEASRVAIDDAHRTGKTQAFEYEVQLPDGGKQAYEARISATEGKECVVICRDITPRKRAEEALKRAHDELEDRVRQRTADLQAANEALRQTHEHVQAVYDGMVDGFIIFDIEAFQTIRANPALCRMTGYDEVEFKALTPEQKHPAEALPRLWEHYRSVLRDGQGRIEAVPCVTNDGGLIYLDLVARRIDYQGRPCVLIFCHDVTQRNRALTALQKERRTLSHMLRASDHERQLIAYDIHDGLAQQLAGAMMQFQIYEHRRESQPEEAAEAYAAGTTMLKQSHFEARRLISGVRPPVLDEAGVVEAVAHLVHEQNRASAAKIEVHSKVKFDRLPPVLENAIYRIIQEGLANACKYSESPRIRVTLVQTGLQLRIEIRDWGIGFSPKDVGANQFGLQGIRQRARLLGGRCRIQSHPETGTRITIDLPLLAGDSDE